MTSIASIGARNGSTPSPHSKATLRHLETSEGVYGSAELTSEFLPGPARQQALLADRITKAVEYVATAPKATIEGLVEALGVSRPTVYRLLAKPMFQEVLRKALTGRVAMSVQRAFSVVEETMESGSPSLKLRAAQLLIERHDKLSAVAGAAPAGLPKDGMKAVEALVTLELIRLRRDVLRAFPEPLNPDVRLVLDRVLAVLSLPRGAKADDDELLDAALEA